MSEPPDSPPMAEPLPLEPSALEPSPDVFGLTPGAAIQPYIPGAPAVFQVAPGAQAAALVPTVEVPASAEQEVLSIMRSRARFASDPELKAMTRQLLGAGYTPLQVARKLGLHRATVHDWVLEPDMKAAIVTARERLQTSLGYSVQASAVSAIDTLNSLMLDPTVPAKERIRAAEAILDRSGVAPKDDAAAAAPPVAIELDFDKRLARIVANGQTNQAG